MAPVLVDQDGTRWTPSGRVRDGEPLYVIAGAPLDTPRPAQSTRAELAERDGLRFTVVAEVWLPHMGPRPGSRLTAREREALTLLARGCSNSQAASVMAVSVETVKCLTKHARRRLGAVSSLHAVALAIGSGQLPADVALPARTAVTA